MGEKTKGEQGKEKLIECAARLFLHKGYSATGINEILDNAAMTKGSFYFYFSSKKELAIKVSEYYRENLKRWILSKFEGGVNSWEDFVTSLIGDKIADAEQERYFGCPVAVLGTEVAYLEPEIAEKYTEIFQGMIQLFERILKRSGISEERVPKLAKQAFILYEGHLLYYRISKDIHQLELLREELIALYRKEKEELK